MDIRKDLHSWLGLSMSANIAAMTNTQVGAIIDTQGFNILEFLLVSTTITTGLFVPSIMGSNDPAMAGAVAIIAPNLLGTPAGATFNGSGDSNKIKSLGVILSTLRYVQLTITGSTSPVGILGQIALLSNPADMYNGFPNTNVSV